MAWIDGVRFGKHDLPPSRATYGMFGNLPEGEGRWETEADRAMAEALAEAGDAAEEKAMWPPASEVLASAAAECGGAG